MKERQIFIIEGDAKTAAYIRHKEAYRYVGTFSLKQTGGKPV